LRPRQAATTAAGAQVVRERGGRHRELTGIEAIAELAGAAALADLRERLGNEDPEVVKVALDRIARLDAGVAEEKAAIALLNHHDPEVRFAAVRFAAERPGSRTLSALRRRRDVERDSSVREALLGALERRER
jgi:hypothetical protein